MSEISDFFEHFDPLVVGDVATSYYQIIQEGSEQVWGTYPAPGMSHLSSVEGFQGRVGDSLPTGQHSFRLHACAANGRMLGQIGWTVSGRSQGARQAISDTQSMAKSLRMNVDTAHFQIQQSEAAREAAETRALSAERKVGEMMGEHIRIVDMCHTMMLNQERGQLDKEEHDARMEVLKMLGAALVPLANKFAETGAEAFDHKVNMWRADWRDKESARKAEEDKKKNGAAAPPNGEEQRHGST